MGMEPELEMKLEAIFCFGLQQLEFLRGKSFHFPKQMLSDQRLIDLIFSNVYQL